MRKENIKPEGGLRTKAEQEAGKEIADIFQQSPDSPEVKLDNFPKYIRRQKLTGLLARYELFNKVLQVKGSVIECGVYRGAGLMTWAHLSAILEPNNLTRRIYGFDTFQGFPSLKKQDKGRSSGKVRKGGLGADSFEELQRIISVYDKNRFLGHVPKIELVRGNAVKTIPKFVEQNQHLVVSLLFLDFDLFEPTKTALEHFYTRMPKGSVLAFDELDNPLWPGETTALLETIGIRKFKIERIPFDPYIGYTIL